MKKQIKIHFNKKQISMLVFPLIAEQILAVSVGMADMIMVSGAGDVAVSGVSLVNTISNLLIYVFEALVAGGAVVAAQAIGAKKLKTISRVANQLILICIVSAVAICSLCLVFNRQILGLIYGTVEKKVMENAVTYFYITSFSFPFLSIYYGSTALFRAMGNTKLSMYVSFVMNLLNIGGNAVFIYGFHMGIAGVGLSTLISRVLAAIVVILMLRDQSLVIHIDRYLRLGYDRDIIGKILKIGIPSGIDSAMFQIGKLFTQSLITSFGTASIAANAAASTIELLATIPASAMGLALTTVIGQCIGAGDTEGVKFYTKKLMLAAYAMIWMLNIVILFMTPTIASWYHLSREGDYLARQLIRYHSVCCMIAWPAAFTLPAVLRAAGDVKYVMFTSMGCMWFLRIALAYVIGDYLGMGVLGVWIAMTIDWLGRSVCNLARLKSEKWSEKSVV